MEKIFVKKLQDSDCHWYWIPKNLVEDFNNENDYLSDKFYVENASMFDDFITKYDKYRTGGCPNNTPEIFKNKNVIFIK
ncbi:MAG: hypothetical protein KGV59_01455 [Tenacibaculum sp.]|nr:hypothetical protein [Tenacibaculum sp.]